MPKDDTPEDLEALVRELVEDRFVSEMTKLHAETMAQLTAQQASIMEHFDRIMERFDRMGDTMAAIRDGVRAAIPAQSPPLSAALALDIARKYERLADTLRGAGQVPGADQAERDARRWLNYGHEREER